MRTIFVMLCAFFVFGKASAQTDSVRKVTDTNSQDKAATQRGEVLKARKNPDGTQKATKTYEGTTKPNTNAMRNNTTGSPVPVRKATDTTATPSGTMGADRPKSGTTTKSPNTTSPTPNNGSTIPRM